MKAIRVSNDWQKALVYYIRYKFVKQAAKDNPDRIDFFTVEWEFSNDKDTDRYVLILDDFDNPVSTVRFLIDNNAALVERVRTLPGEERKGYGREAMLEAERWALDLGVSKAFVEAIPKALDFYKAIGYSFSDFKGISRNHNDLFLMEKDL